MFSAIVPTLQRSPHLIRVLDTFRSHDLVDEVIVINNAGPARPLPDLGPKVRVLNPEENIYVNPAWNLGAAQAQSDFLVVSNDDVLFPRELIDGVARKLNPAGGVIGPHPSCLTARTSRPLSFRPAYHRRVPFGVLFFLARAAWVPIPDDLLIWCGDDWIFAQQHERNYTFTGPSLRTTPATTSGRPEFTALKYADLARYESAYAGDTPYERRFAAEAALSRRAREVGRFLRRGRA